MTNLVTKKKIFFITTAYILYFIVLLFVSVSCNDEWCRIREDGVLVSVLYGLAPLGIIFIFSLITYFMREEVFRAWWNFARWWIPVIIVGTILCNMMPSNRGFFNMDALIYLMVLAPLYSILILGSLWKIVRTHLRLKKEGR